MKFIWGTRKTIIEDGIPSTNTDACPRPLSRKKLKRLMWRRPDLTSRYFWFKFGRKSRSKGVKTLQELLERGKK